MTDYLNFKVDLDDSEVAGAFDELTYWSSMFGQLLFRHLRLMPRISALDVGCGTGFPLLELADRLGPTCQVRGVDSWAQAVDLARRKTRIRGNSNVAIDLCDAADMPYDDNSFDLIVSNLGVNNFADPTAVMAECERVCKPQGRIALTTNLMGHMHEFYGIFERVLVETGLAHLVGGLNRHQAHRATRDSLHQLFSDAGFDVSEWHLETFTLRYVDGSAFFRAYLTRLGFLDGWRKVLSGSSEMNKVFGELESRLNHVARETPGGLTLSIPAGYIEGRRVR